MSTSSFWRHIALLVAAALLMAFSCTAQDDGDKKLDDETVGPYQLSVWVSPEPPIVGSLRIAAQLRASETDALTTAPTITITASAPHTDVLEWDMMRMAESYAADIDLPYAATWQIEIHVEDGTHKATASFPLHVQPAPIDNNLVRLAAFATLVVLATGWWFWGRHPRKKRVRKRIFMPRPDE